MAEMETCSRKNKISTISIPNDVTCLMYENVDRSYELYNCTSTCAGSHILETNETDQNNDVNTTITGDAIDACDTCSVVNDPKDRNDNSDNLYKEVQKIRTENLNNIIISHLNVNSLGSKINEIKELQKMCKLDVLVLSETKLDGSYKQEGLDIEGYCCIRRDKRSNSGGLLVYVSNDIPFSEGEISICNDELECISIELNVADEKIMLLGMYKNPKTDPVLFKRAFSELFEIISDSHENIVIIGDLNFNMLKENMLSNIIPAFSLTNIIKDVTCFKSSQATLIDVMLVTKRRKFLTTFSLSTGISDFHNLIGGVLRLYKPAPESKKVSVRKLSRINYDQVLIDITKMDLSNAIDSSPDVNSAYDIIHDNLCSLLEKHAPKIQKVIRKNDFHCMSKELKKEILYRNRLRNKYFKFRSNHYLMLYRAQRNKVNAVKRKEVSKYFQEKCKLGTRNKDFWKAIKPLFSKSRTKCDSIPLRENGEIITDSQKVCNIFNSFFQSIGSNIGLPEDNEKPLEDIIMQYQEHASVKRIKETINGSHSPKFIFRFIT